MQLFGGGYNGTGASNVVDIFDSLSEMWNTTTLSQARWALASTSVRNLAFFGGGYDGKQPSKVVDIFNSTSQTWNTVTLNQARYVLASSSIGEIVAFGGGYHSNGYSNVVDIFEISLSTSSNTQIVSTPTFSSFSTTTSATNSPTPSQPLSSTHCYL
jgi:hypothetical protein